MIQLFIYILFDASLIFLIGKDDGGHFDIPKIYNCIFIKILFKIKYPK